MHWGQKIITGMILFMLFILGMSYYMFLHHTDTLVDNDYYEKGIAYDSELIKKNNALDSTALPDITFDSAKLEIDFKYPSTFVIDLKRPANAVLDRSYNSDKAVLKFEQSIANLKSGLWVLEINWTANGKDYLLEQHLKK